MLWLQRTHKTKRLLVDGAIVHFELSEKNFRRISRFSVGVLLVGIVLLLYPLTPFAYSGTFYPTVCLGDWENPSRATGKPDGVGNTGEGAAILTTQGADIFCSSFVGSREIPRDASIIRAYIQISWNIGEISFVDEESEDEDSSLKDTVSTEENEDGENIHTGNVSEEESVDESDVGDVVVSEESSGEDIHSDDEQPIENVSLAEPVEEEPVDTPEEVQEPDPEPEVVSEPEAEASLFRRTLAFFISQARAEEIVPDVTEETEKFPQEEIEISPQEEETIENNIETEEDIAEDITEKKEEDQTKENIDTVVNKKTPIQKGGTNPEFVAHISYSLDGIEWHKITSAPPDSKDILTIKIPIENLEDIDTLQVLIQGDESNTSVPVYLDGMKLVIEYDSVDLNQNEILFDERGDDGELLPMRVFTDDVVVDEFARHTCEASVPQFDISSHKKTVGEILLHPGGFESKVEIGSLPRGVDIFFSKSNDHTVYPEAEETTIAFEIQRDPRAQKGNFSIPVMYTKRGEYDSVVVCQLNIINK